MELSSSVSSKMVIEVDIDTGLFHIFSGFLLLLPHLLDNPKMYVSSVTALALFAAFVAGKKCINQTVPVTITARQPRFNAAIPQTSLEVQDFILNMTQQGRNFTDIILEGYGDVSGTYNVSTQFCTPDNSNATVPAVQVLTHGIGFDKT